MYGDTKFEWVASGSTTASAATAHALFGVYNGLSLLNPSDVLLVSVLPATNDAEILPSVTLSPGMLVSTSQSLYQPLMPMSALATRNLHFRNSVGASNSTLRWVVWRRVP
jgi:hypothetical protein